MFQQGGNQGIGWTGVGLDEIIWEVVDGGQEHHISVVTSQDI